MQIKNKGNTVSNNSKLMMEKALLKLMEIEKYEEITIQEITDNACLSRRTFYRNYSSKDEIIVGCYMKIWTQYENVITKEEDLSLPNVAKVLFTVMKKHIDFLLLCNRQKLLHLFLPKVDEDLPIIFEKFKGSKMNFSKECIEYALTFSTGGFVRILVKWLQEGAKKTPEEMGALVKNFVLISNYNIK